jgi:hypothetical protein
LLAPSRPTLRVLDLTGHEVISLLKGDRQLSAGSFHIAFDTRTLPEGSYVIEYRVGSFRAMQRLVVLK